MENESKTENKNQVARLLEKHGDRVFRTAFMYLKNYQDAEDVLQMTFEKYLITKPLFKEEVNQRDVERGLSLKNPTVTGLLKRLEEKGYI